MDASLRATLNVGDEVIYHEPCFVAYAPCIQLAGGTAVPVATTAATDFRVTAAMIEAAVTPRTKGIFLGYPNNPTGAALDRSELEAIARVADEHDLLVYSDEIYDRLVYGGHEHTAFSSLPGMRERSVLLGGFSKSYAMTGWRIGYVAAPAELMAGIAKVHQYAIMCAPTPAQFAAIEALRSGEPHVVAMHDEYDRRRRYMTDRFNQIGLACFEPMGAFYCFPRVTDATGLDDGTFAEKLLDDERVGVVPGRRVRSQRRGPRPRLLRDRVRGDRRGHGPHRAVRGAPPSVTLQRAGGAAAFSSSAAAYATTMAPALRPVAAEVVRRAALRPGESVLDIGTGTGTAAGLATGDGRRVVGVDAAPGMLEIARREVPGVEFVEADFTDLPMADGSFDVVIAAHALLFADDRVATLREWLRVAAPGGRHLALGARAGRRRAGHRPPRRVRPVRHHVGRRLPDRVASSRAGPRRRAGLTSRRRRTRRSASRWRTTTSIATG